MTKTEKMISLLTNIVLQNGDEATAAKELKTMLDECAYGNGRDSLEREVEKLLTEIGVPCHILGYNYLKKVIAFAADDPTLRCKASVLYVKVAKAVGGEATASRVERAIRHAIELSWDRCCMDVLNKYFGNTVDPRKGKSTNGEFISIMAREISQRTAY